MAVQYTKADTVWPGKALSSRDYNKLALAFNDRLKNGVADVISRDAEPRRKRQQLGRGG